MARPRVPIDPVADLKRRLGRGATRATVRRCVRRWWRDHELAAHPAVVGKRIAIALLEQPTPDGKRAGILVLEEVLGEHLRASDLPVFARLFARGHVARRVADELARRVLATLLDRAPGRAEAARQLAHWRASESTCQRRAACLAFERLAAEANPMVAAFALAICATVVWSPERLEQRAVGSLLCELSRAAPVHVEGFFVRHARLMSRECARHAVAALPIERRAVLLAHHRRATSLRR